MSGIPDVPPPLRAVAHYIKIANEYASRDVVIYYWTLYYAIQHGMTLDKSSPPAIQFLTTLLATLEKWTLNKSLLLRYL
uniref:Vta1/callose synthase N-terminal domain-containing protein n=1 Tax=Acrobeloides nanus TaxID=290746 RepID=A0A914CTE8_9BILA